MPSLKSSGLSPATLTTLGIPDKYKFLYAASFPFDRKPLTELTSFVSEFPGSHAGVRLQGPPVSGKTFLACYVLKLLAFEKRVVGFYISMPDLIEMYFSGAYGEFKRTVKAPPILVIDNVNAPRHEGQKNALLRALRIRSDDGKPFVLVTNLREKLFDDCYCVYHTRQGASAAETFRDDEVSKLCSRELLNIATYV